MKVTFLGHAGLFIQTPKASILCDPWFHPAYFGAWFPFPSNEHVDRTTIASPTYLYISHLHRDHFDPAFLRDYISKETTVLLPAYPLNLLEQALRHCGFTNFIAMKNGHMLTLDGLRVMTLAMVTPVDGPLGDSAIVIDDGSARIFNQNDAHPIDLEYLRRSGPYDAHFLQCSGAIWYPMVYQYPEKMLQALGRKKRANEMARALRYIRDLNARIVIPSAGPPCFLDDTLFALNDFDCNPHNTFPDQAAFLAYLHQNGVHHGRLMIPGSVMTLTQTSCDLLHPLPEAQIQAIFTQKRHYLEAYRIRMQPIIDAEKCSWPRGQVDIGAALKAWFEPLLQQAPLLCAGVNGLLLLDCEREHIIVDFRTRSVSSWQGEAWDYRFHIDHALVEYCILHHEEDWVNQLFLSFRFEAQRKGVYNEYLYIFFKCLTPQRLEYVENYYAEKASEQHYWTSHGYHIQKSCPHLKADLTRFARIEHGILTCTMHGWQFDLATGRCLTSDGYRLLTQHISDDMTTDPDTTHTAVGEAPQADMKPQVSSQVQSRRDSCAHCWYRPTERASSPPFLPVHDDGCV